MLMDPNLSLIIVLAPKLYTDISAPFFWDSFDTFRFATAWTEHWVFLMGQMLGLRVWRGQRVKVRAPGGGI